MSQGFGTKRAIGSWVEQGLAQGKRDLVRRLVEQAKHGKLSHEEADSLLRAKAWLAEHGVENETPTDK